MIQAQLVALLLTGVISAAGAWHVQGWRYGAREAARLEHEAEVKRQNAHGAQLAAGGHEADREALRAQFLTITETVEKIVQEPVYRNVCFDADGLRAIGAAVAGHRSAAGQPGTAVR